MVKDHRATSHSYSRSEAKHSHVLFNDTLNTFSTKDIGTKWINNQRRTTFWPFIIFKN